MFVASDGEGACPGAVAAVQMLQLRRAAGHIGFDGKQGAQPFFGGIVAGGQKQFAFGSPIAGGGIGHVVEEVVEDGAGRDGFVGIGGVGAAGGGHGGGKLGQTAGVVFAVEDGLPAGFVTLLLLVAISTRVGRSFCWARISRMKLMACW